MHTVRKGDDVDTRIPRGEQYLALPLASMFLHIQGAKKRPGASDAINLGATLNDVARALSMVAAIYAQDSVSGLPVKIPESALIGATFTGGATVMVAADGTQFENLTVKRADVERAGRILGGSTSLHDRWANDGG